MARGIAPRNPVKRNKMNYLTKVGLILTVPLMLGGMMVMAAGMFDTTAGQHTPSNLFERAVDLNDPIDLGTVKACRHEYPTLEETYPCQWDPTKQAHYADGDSTTITVMFRPEDGCPQLPLGAVCLDVSTFNAQDAPRSDLGPQNVIRWSDGTVEWTTTRGD